MRWQFNNACVWIWSRVSAASMISLADLSNLALLAKEELAKGLSITQWLYPNFSQIVPT